MQTRLILPEETSVSSCKLLGSESSGACLLHVRALERSLPVYVAHPTCMMLQANPSILAAVGGWTSTEGLSQQHRACMPPFLALSRGLVLPDRSSQSGQSHNSFTDSWCFVRFHCWVVTCWVFEVMCCAAPLHSGFCKTSSATLCIKECAARSHA